LKKIIKNIFLILNSKEKNKFIKLILFDIIISALDILFIAALLYIVHFYTEGHHKTNTSRFAGLLFSRSPLLLIAVFFLLFSIKNYLGFLVFRMQFKFVYSVASRLSKDNLQYYFNGSYPDYVNIDSSVHNREIGQQPIEFGHYIVKGVQQIISQLVLILITVTAILIYNPVLFPLLLIILTPPIIITGFLLKRKLNSIRKTAKVASEKTTQHLQEAISGYVESNIYNRHGFFINRYASFQARFNDFLADQQIVQNMPSRLIEVFAVFGLFALIFINSFTANTSTVNIITIGAFMAAAYKIIPGIVKILNSVGQINTFSFVIDGLLKYVDYVEIKKVKNNGSLTSIRFQNVLFRYNKELILDNFSLGMSKGDFIGLSGTSGKGKTTVVNLLLGFLKADLGYILFNDSITDTDIRQRYWNHISYIRQQPFLIHDTILNNIILGEDNYDGARLNDIIKATGLKDFIHKFPEGFNKIISENGKNISGGQRQRIMIARALYKNADLIILDEPFNELDRNAENLLLTHFKNLAQSGKMILLITHNKESLAFCNKIISLDERQTINIYNN
jgi:ABC-type multidrug transport system fused ATPase/permease subunit